MNRFSGYRTFQQDNRIGSRVVEMSTDDRGPGGAVILRVA